MEKVGDIVEKELKDKGIFYLRTGTKFGTKQCDLAILFEAQAKANEILISNGTITQEMIKKDIKHNFS